jgi:hypothetical protein
VSAGLELWLLVAICGLATFAWRGAGVFVSGGINPNSPCSPGSAASPMPRSPR